MKTPADAADFVATVAEHFIERRGRGAMLSPADLSCLAAWEDEGIGAATAVRGIDETFRRGGEIRSLRQCRWAVEEERRKAQAGAAARAADEEPPLEGKLAALAAALDEAARGAAAAYRPAVEDAAATVRKLAAEPGREGAGAAEMQTALDAVEDDLLVRIEAAVLPAERAALEAAAREKLRGRDLSAEVARRTVRAITLRELRRRLRLPSFAI
ncbi:MAG TPA: hypothetical protein VMW93_06785 [bacterium]|nr:hypothetical protein [bacterium]